MNSEKLITLECDHCGGNAYTSKDQKETIYDGEENECEECGFPGHVVANLEEGGICWVPAEDGACSIRSCDMGCFERDQTFMDSRIMNMSSQYQKLRLHNAQRIRDEGGADNVNRTIEENKLIEDFSDWVYREYS